MPAHGLPTVPGTPLEFRVIEGEQRGARTIIDASKPFVVSSGMASDVVLRGCGRDEFDLAIRLRQDCTRLRVWVRQGQVTADGRAHGPGAKFDVLLYTSLRVGGSVIAIGMPGNPAWGADASATPTLEQVEDPSAEPPASLSPGDSRLDADRAPAGGRWSRRLLAGGTALACASFGALVFAYSILPEATPVGQQAMRAEETLRAAGFPGLQVKANTTGRELVVSGYLDTTAQRAQVEQIMSRQPLPGRLSVWVNDSLSQAVQDVFRVNGVTALAQATGPGIVTAQTSTGDLAALRRIQASARRDVPGLAELRLDNDPPREPPTPVRALDDPGKRIASIVPGDMPYVVTTDGTRYFEGALLPTGHRIAEIRDREVMLEIDGQLTPLRF